MRTFAPILLLICFVSFAACGPKTVPGSFREGQVFTSVSGESLDKKPVRIPEELAGKVSILLVGYVQNAQFDIDRWILGFLQLGTPAKLLEIPTVAGMIPSLIENYINDGMRKGIPREDWNSVVTVYKDSDKIIELLGNERRQNAYVVVLDKRGAIRAIENEGYSATRVQRLDQIVKSLLD